ncbi:MAG: helix-turn-helix domain-containing protein [Segetibacter sp.]
MYVIFGISNTLTRSSENIPFRLMADGFPSLLFQYKNQFKDSTTLTYSFPGCLLLGHTYNLRNLVIDGPFGVFGVALFPYTPSLLYQLPGSIFANNIISAEDLFKHEDSYLEERVALAKSNEDRIQILTVYLVEKLCKCNSRTDVLIQDMVQHIIQTKGVLPIETLILHASISRRQFERRFIHHVGMSPKLFSRIIRFQNTLRYPPNANIRNLTSLAFAHGYADQAHFIREFKEFSGINPKYYFTHHKEAAENLIQL